MTGSTRNRYYSVQLNTRLKYNNKLRKRMRRIIIVEDVGTITVCGVVTHRDVIMIFFFFDSFAVQEEKVTPNDHDRFKFYFIF